MTRIVFVGSRPVLTEGNPALEIPSAEHLEKLLGVDRLDASRVDVDVRGADGTSVHVHVLPEEDIEMVEASGLRAYPLRSAWRDLTPEAFRLVGTARQKADWVLTHRFCSRCAAPTALDPKTAEFTVRISANDYGQTVILLPLINQVRRLAPGIRIAVMPFETVELGEIAAPALGPDQVLVRVHASSVNPADYKVVSGRDGARFIHSMRFPMTFGYDFSGVVEAIGASASGCAVAVAIPTSCEWVMPSTSSESKRTNRRHCSDSGPR